MKKRAMILMMVFALTGGMLSGCGSNGAASAGSSQSVESLDTAETDAASAEAGSDTTEMDAASAEAGSDTTETDAAATEAGSDATETDAASVEEKTDEELAAECSALIEALKVQVLTETTDQDIAAARAAWDALTDAQKEMVEDPDYFGRDTGDASADDPLNADGIGENELLVVSFGTSFNDSRAADIGGIEKALQEAYPDWSVRRAFTAQIVINHIKARDGEAIDNVEQALTRAKENGVRNLVIQPTHLMHGAEYDELLNAVEDARADFISISIAEPLLGEVGTDASVINEDKEAVAKAIVEEAMKTAGFESLEAAEEAGAALVLMGHGTAHVASVSYSQMQTQMDTLGYRNVFIGTVEGEPEGTACEDIIEKVREAGYKQVILRPLMVVAGDHANNDMAGEEEDSWMSMFVADGSFDSVDAQLEGLGRISAIQVLYVAHTADALADMDAAKAADEAALEAPTLEDGVYTASFNTDSSMFRVNETLDGKGTLTVADGRMTIHVTLVSQKILNLFPGTAEEAQREGAALLQPTLDKVTYSDGMTEEVYGFDIPVPAIGEEFDCALVGEKGKWYDHKVSVTDPVKAE